MRIAVYTSITASKDSLKRPRDCSGADLVLFSDQPKASIEPGWDVRRACDLFVDARRNSRAPKFLAHQYLAGYEYSLWVDGSIRLIASPRDLVEKYLGQADIALFRHPDRSCAYDEAAVCTARHLDDVGVIAFQMAEYRREGYPARHGLNEAGVILRRHNASIEAFNNAWWSEFCRHSCRDQLSLNYTLHKLGIQPALFQGTLWANHGLVAQEGHLR